MKNIKFAICAVAVSGFLNMQAFAFDLDTLTTLQGDVYHQVKVINSDHNGVLFRHSKGASKESFNNLSKNVRELFQPTGKGSSSKGAPHSQPTDKGGSDQAGKGSAEQEYVLTIITRRQVAAPQTHCSPQLRHNFPVHQRGFNRGIHRLHDPYYRAQANLNFLRFNGLLPSSHGRGHLSSGLRFH